MSARARALGGAGVARHSSVQVLDRAFAVLKLFTQERPTWHLTEIADELQLKLATAHRIVRSLCAHGYLWVEGGGSKSYRLGVAALVLGARAERSLDFVAAAIPALRSLADTTGETCFMLVPSEDRRSSVCVARAEGAERLRLSVDVGRRIPIFAGAGQKALLAFYPDHERGEVVAEAPSPDELLEQLSVIRSRGWAISFEETHPGTWGVAVPLVDAAGSVVCAIGLAGPLLRYDEEVGLRWLDACTEQAVTVADALQVSAPAREVVSAGADPAAAR